MNPCYKYLFINIKNNYFKNPAPNHEYYKITLSLISQDIMNKYDITEKNIYGFIYVKVEKGMYGLFQAAISTHGLQR